LRVAAGQTDVFTTGETPARSAAMGQVVKGPATCQGGSGGA
jgi:hypothetical protein